jgi:hypothetical protein
MNEWFQNDKNNLILEEIIAKSRMQQAVVAIKIVAT